MIRLRILRWGDQSGLSWWAQCNPRVLLTAKEGGRRVRVRERCKDRSKVRVIQFLDWAASQQQVGSLWELGKARKTLP